jgi:plastocyanin
MRSSTLITAASLLMIACSGKPSAPAGGNQLSTESGAAPAARTSTVLVSQFKFRPETVTVSPGDTVEWKNADAVPHALISQDKKTIQSGNIEKHASWTFRAEKEGTYDYQCLIHPTMKARLIVQSAQAAAAAKPSAGHAALTRSR